MSTDVGPSTRASRLLPLVLGLLCKEKSQVKATKPAAGAIRKNGMIPAIAKSLNSGNIFTNQGEGGVEYKVLLSKRKKL